MSQKENEKVRLLVKTYVCNILNKENFISVEDKIRQINAKIIEIQSLRTRNSYERRIVNQIVEIYRAEIKVKLFGIEKIDCFSFMKGLLK